jgi:hypothetical protein
MQLHRIATFIAIAAIAVAILSYCPLKETWTEVNAATGAMRTRNAYFFVFEQPWEGRPTWVSIRAAELGVNTDAEWQQITHHTDRLMLLSHGCSRAPEAYFISLCDESQLTPEQRDRFVIAFTKASEPARKEMIGKLVDGETAVP